MPERGTHPRTLTEEASRPIIRHALDAGINFFDTANMYSDGASEEILGASSMHAWQFAKALYMADLHGFTRLVSMQHHLNPMYREEEREMPPLCADQGIAVVAGTRARAGAWRVTGPTPARARTAATRCAGCTRPPRTPAAAWPRRSNGSPQAALELALSPEEIAELEAPYLPHAVAGRR